MICIFSFLVLIYVSGSAFSENPDAKKGDALLKEMSQKLAAARLFSFSTTEFHDRLRPTGKRVQINVTRDVLVRRPNGFWTKYKGDRDFEFWYDGKQLTGISNEKKIYIQHEMPPTLDETLDMLAARLNIDLPMSDLLYSSPYEAFIDNQTHGGFVGKEIIAGSSCSHLSYSATAVDWQLWINEKSSLPCQLQLTYKTDKGNSNYKITFSKWNLKPEMKSDVFASKIPDGYVRIPILERVTMQQTQTSRNP
ncbi:MAG TPA: DUF2092 domain-containing protein [Acidobacteriota bacterium]